MSTTAPDDLRVLQRYLHEATGLPLNALGIVGDESHTRGYHVGYGDLKVHGHLADYSRRQRRDQVRSDAASALDVGDWPGLRAFSIDLVIACRRRDPRTASIRQVIYSPDGRHVVQWDAIGEQSGGDDSHLTHTHISFWRDTEGKRGPLLDLFKELIEGKGDDDVSAADVWGTKYREYIDQDGNGKRDPRTAADILYSTHSAAVATTRALAESKLRDKAILAAVQGLPSDQILAQCEALAAQLTRLPDEVVDALVDEGREPAEIAAALRAVLGDKAPAVGKLLAG